MPNGLDGLLADAFNSPTFNLGIGLLAANAPSLVPTSTGQRLAQGVQNAQRASIEALQNQLLRDRITAMQRQRDAIARLRQQFGADGGVAGLVAEIAPEQFAQAAIESIFPSQRASTDVQTMQALGFPLTAEGYRAFKAAGGGGADTLQASKLRMDLASQQSALWDQAISAQSGLRALDILENIPGASALVTNPSLVAIARRALSAAELDPTGVLKGLPNALAGLTPEQLERAVSAAETVEKQRSNLAASLGTSNQAGAQGLAARLKAFGENAGIDVQREVLQQVLQRTLREAEAGGFPLEDVTGEPALKPIRPPRVPPRTSGGMIPPQAVRDLRANPQLRDQFEEKYGVSADAFLR